MSRSKPPTAKGRKMLGETRRWTAQNGPVQVRTMTDEERARLASPRSRKRITPP